MKKLIFLGFLFLAAISQGQTISEISRIMNSGPKAIASNSASSLNADILPELDLTNAGYKIISVDIAGTWSGTITFQGRSRTGTWYSIASYSPDNVGTFILSTISNGHFNIPTLGFDAIRIRMTSYSSGTATSIVSGFFNNIFIPTPTGAGGGGGGGSGTQYLNGAGSGSPTGTLALGYDGSNLRALKTDATGVLNVSGTASQNSSGVAITTTSITANNQNAFSLDLSSTPYRGISVQITGTWNAILNFQGSNDNSNWVTLLCNTRTSGIMITDISTNDLYNIPCPFRYIRLRSTSYTSGTVVATAYGFLSAFDLNDAVSLPTGSGTAAGALRAVLATDQGAIPTNATLQAGSAIAGKFGIDQTTNGTTNRVNIGTDGTVTVNALPGGSNIIGKVSIDQTTPGTTNKIDIGSNGTVIANAGANLNTSALALDATLTNRSQLTKITDGTNDATVKAASTAAGATDKALVVAVSPNNSVFTNSVAPVSITASNITGVNTNVFSIDLATSGASYRGIGVMLTGTWSAILNFQGSNDNSNWVTIMAYSPGAGVNTTNLFTNDLYNVSCSGMRYIRLRCTSFTSGTVVPFVYGYLSGFEMNTLNLSGSVSLNGTSAMNIAQVNGATVPTGNGTAAGAMRVVLPSDQTAFSVNAGTNLNTSALALETGGNLASIKTNTDNLNFAQASTTSGQKGPLIQGAVTTAAPTYTTAQTNPLSLTTAGALRTDIGTNGTVTANAGTNLNTSTLALETGGNLATVKTNTDNLALAQASTTSGQKGNLVLTATTTAAPTYTTAQSNPLSTTTAGALRVDVGTNGTVAANLNAGTNVIGKVSIDQTTPGTTNLVQVGGSLPAGTNGIGKLTANSGVVIGDVNVVTAPTLTKGTQGNGFSTQDLKDAGRTTIALTIDVAGAATSEALATVTESRNGASTSTFTSKTITNGKRIRFQHIAIEVETLGSGTAPQRVYLRLRVNTAGATTASSPLQGVWACVNNTAVVKTGATANYEIPDGLEFAGDGTATYGLTLTFPDWVSSTATVNVRVTVIAFEY